MGNVKLYRSQHFDHDPDSTDDEGLWLCISMMLETSNGPIVLGQWIPEDIAKIKNERLATRGPLSAKDGISFFTDEDSNISDIPGPIFVRGGDIRGVSAHASADTIISRWANLDGNRIQARKR
jgi:hypothetical protein